MTVLIQFRPTTLLRSEARCIVSASRASISSTEVLSALRPLRSMRSTSRRRSLLLMFVRGTALTPTFSLRFRAPRLLLRAFLQVCEQHSREVPLVVYSEIRSGNGSPPLSQIPGDSVLSLILPFS